MGAVICRALADEGARIVLAGRDVEALERHAATLVSEYPDSDAIYTHCDVVVERDTQALAAFALERLGRVDILVNTAGVTGPIETPAHEVALEDFEAVVATNLTGTFLACKAVIPAMIADHYGRIINVAGTSGLRGYRNRAGYSASKWAVRGLTRTLALELGPHDVTVNAICPNVTDGERMRRIVATKAEKLGSTDQAVYEDFASQTALGRFVEDTDIAQAVTFLASAGARNITGHDIIVDAGWDV